MITVTYANSFFFYMHALQAAHTCSSARCRFRILSARISYSDIEIAIIRKQEPIEETFEGEKEMVKRVIHNFGSTSISLSAPHSIYINFIRIVSVCFELQVK